MKHKLCIECKWYRKRRYHPAECLHEEVKIETEYLVYGVGARRCAFERVEADEGFKYAVCRREGKLWEAKEERRWWEFWKS